jgi:hypothetical protein
MAVSNSKTTDKKKAPTSKKAAEAPYTSEASVVVDNTEFVKSDESVDNIVRLKLMALYSLQVIDTQVDKIRIIRGELPLEVQDLEDEIAGLSTRLENNTAEITELNRAVTEYNEEIARSREMIKKYEQQQKNVRNNREYESLSKEIEFQGLEIQLREKKLREASVAIDAKNKLIDDVKAQLEAKESNLRDKNAELSEIIAETEKEEQMLMVKSEKAKAIIEDRYLTAYTRIRKSVRNGLAVVKIERNACGGCFSKIPPQRQLEIRMHKKILVCEYCGRIIVDETIADTIETSN